MLFSSSTEYALRVMAHIAINSANGPLRAKEVSASANIPLHYCSKILRSMVTAGLLKGTKGHGGGFVLSRSPSRIKFSDIFTAINGEIAPKHCVFGLERCSASNPCPLHHRWSILNETFQEWAAKTTLEEIISDVEGNISRCRPFARSRL